MPGITAAIAPFKPGVEAVVPFDQLHKGRLLQVLCAEVALRIHIRSDMMRNLSGCVAEPHAIVERRGTDPDGPALIRLVPTPEAHMVPLARTATDGLFEGKVLLAVKQKQVAHRGIGVGPT